MSIAEPPAKPCGCPEAGIGQKVKIMAGIGHSAAGRSSQSVHVQLGTGKSSLGRSSQTVHIRGEVVEGTCCCWQDDFDDRTIDATDPGGWGDATSGQTYSTSAPHRFSVSDGIGHFQTGGGDTVVWSINLPSDCAWQQPEGFPATVDFKVATVDGIGRAIKFLAAGGGPSCEFDVIPDTGYGSLAISNDNGDADVAKLDWVADTWYTLRFEYRPGLVQRLKVWPRDDPEPGTWDLELTDTDVGEALTGSLRLTFSASDEWAVDVDNLVIGGCCGLFDDFDDREIEEGWGDSHPTGQTYVTASPANFSVSDGLGRFTTDGATTLFHQAMPSYCAWQQSGGFLLTFDWFVDSSVDVIFGLGMTSVGAGPFFQFGLERSNVGGGSLLVQSIGTDTVGKSDWDAVAYSVKVEYRPGSVMRMKVWPQGDAEPGAWDVSISGADVDGALDDGLRWNFVGELTFEQNAWIDNVTFDCEPA